MSARDAQRDTAVETYLARLDAALRRLPPAERREIVLETRSHVVEQTGRFPERAAEDVLAELGPPEAYARQFLDEEPAPTPLAPVAPAPAPDALRGIARLATSGWTRLPLLFVVLVAYSFATTLVIVAVWKFFEPDAVGLWGGELGVKGRWAFGVSNPNMPGRELLGYWIVPLALGVAATIHLAMSALLRRLLRDDAPGR